FRSVMSKDLLDALITLYNYFIFGHLKLMYEYGDIQKRFKILMVLDFSDFCRQSLLTSFGSSSLLSLGNFGWAIYLAIFGWNRLNSTWSRKAG
ncbi:MAG: hypothetical protein JXR56_04630, partial [Candidatus Cloacimonetes bacterium]|nr:hypothetical protein [Candidatus Cloacimonadota bacterium]